ncbi:MAG: hypothetical protein ACRD0D_04860, partial [Acidimicrobiales bacterium]
MGRAVGQNDPDMILLRVRTLGRPLALDLHAGVTVVCGLDRAHLAALAALLSDVVAGRLDGVDATVDTAGEARRLTPSLAHELGLGEG